MRSLFIILGFITSTIAVALAVTPLSKIAFIPAVAALVFGLAAFYLSRHKQYPKKSIQLIFLLTIISLAITSYKAVFNEVEVGNVEDLKLKEKESEAKAIEDLEGIDLETIAPELNDTPDLEDKDLNPK